MNNLTKKILIAGLALTILPFVVGPILTAIAMTYAFHDLSPQGIADPKQLSSHIGLILVATAGGLAVSAVGVSMLIVTGIKIYMTSRSTKKSAS